MKSRNLLQLGIFWCILISTAFGQTLSVVQQSPGTYRFTVTGLPHLNKMEPIAIMPDPRYELFFELGDGYYLRKTMPNPASTSTEFTFVHSFGIRLPSPNSVKVTSTPLYSPNKKPTIPDNFPPIVEPMTWIPGTTSGKIKFDFVPAGSMVKADLNWNMLESDDLFIVVAGFQNGSSNQQNFDLSDGGYASIYYDSKLVTPIFDEGIPVFRCRTAGVEYTNIEWGSDPVIDSSPEDLDAKLDFILPPTDQGVEDFIFANFTTNSPADFGENDRFPITVVVWGPGEDGPSENNFATATVFAEYKGGKDPNEITGSPRPACLDSSFGFFDYHIEFFNEGTAIVDSFNIKVTFSEFVELTSYEDIEIVSLRIGNQMVDVTSLTFLPEISGANEFTLVIDQPGFYLQGYTAESIDNNPMYYPYCSAELEIRVPRNMALTSCTSIPAELEIVFPNGIPVSRVDSIPCSCDLGPEPVVFPCNIVPDIPFLGGCWCTLLVILLILIVLFLLFVIWKNSQSS